MTAQTERHITRSESETFAVAQRLARTLRPGAVIALHGPLGAGKTAFVRGVAEGLGSPRNAVSSPTFVIVHEYATKSLTLVHVDAYRLTSSNDLESIGWEELLARPNSIIAVEWAERLGDALPADAVHVEIAYVPGEPSHRSIVIRNPLAAGGRCPICKSPVAVDAEFAPFCSQRCKRADLGRWLKGQYTISRPISERDIESQD